MIRRVPNWDIALFRWSERVTGQPYTWGETDCGSLVREAHALMYGDDLWPDVKPYTGKRAALARHRATGGVAASLLSIGAVSVDVRLAQSGDVLVEDGDEFGAAGVVVGRDVIWASSEEGIVRTPLRGRSGTLLRVPHG